MTREEAIQCIRHELLINVNRKDLTGQAVGEALNMAIEALNEADKREQYGQNYEADDFVKLGVTDKNKDKVILYDAFGEKEYYPQTDLVRCKDCRHADECHKSVQYTRNEPNSVTIGYTKIDFCSHGERREP